MTFLTEREFRFIIFINSCIYFCRTTEDIFLEFPAFKLSDNHLVVSDTVKYLGHFVTKYIYIYQMMMFIGKAA